MANMTRQKEDKANGFLTRFGFASERSSSPCVHTATEVTESSGPALADIFSINLINTMPWQNSKGWMGPSVKMSLPSFSGRTEDNPSLLKYSCQMACRVRLVRPLRVTTSSSKMENQAEQWGSMSLDRAVEEPKTDPSHLSLLVMLSKPVLTLEFNRMNMNVEAPFVISK